MSRLLSGKRGATELDVAAFLGVCRVKGAERDRLLALCQEQHRPGWLQQHGSRHRHITLDMLAHTFLAITAHTTKKRGRHRAAQRDKHDHPSNERAEPETTPPIHRRLITLTLAEIRRLLNLIHHGEHAITHGLHWSTWRRRHQAEARRTHADSTSTR